MMSEKEKMLSGQIYSAVDPELLRELNECKDIVHRYNGLLPSMMEALKAVPAVSEAAEKPGVQVLPMQLRQEFL